MTNFAPKSLSLFSKLGIFALLAGITFVSCDTTSTNGNGNARITLQFQTAATAANTPSAIPAKSSNTPPQKSNGPLTIKGSNGTLTITDIHFIVDDFELEKADAVCDEQTGKMEEDGCEEFESKPFFVNLPLGNQPLSLSTSAVNDGSYSELEFEISDFDADEQDDPAEAKQMKALLTHVQKAFPDWPKSASMVISGKFKSNTGELTEFTTYAEAEVSIEMQLDPPLEIQAGTGHKLTVKINPDKWFTRNDGTVFNLANYDYSLTGKVLEFETEMENGFFTAEFEED